MAMRCEFIDEARDVIADLFIEAHGRGRTRLSDCQMLDGVVGALRGCRMAR